MPIEGSEDLLDQGYVDDTIVVSVRCTNVVVWFRTVVRPFVQSYGALNSKKISHILCLHSCTEGVFAHFLPCELLPNAHVAFVVAHKSNFHLAHVLF